MNSQDIHNRTVTDQTENYLKSRPDPVCDNYLCPSKKSTSKLTFSNVKLNEWQCPHCSYAIIWRRIQK